MRAMYILNLCIHDICLESVLTNSALLQHRLYWRPNYQAKPKCAIWKQDIGKFTNQYIVDTQEINSLN